VIKFPGCGDALQCAMGYFIWGGFINSVARELAPRHPTPPPILPPAPAILDMHAPSPLAEAGGGGIVFPYCRPRSVYYYAAIFPRAIFRNGGAPAWKLNARRDSGARDPAGSPAGVI